MTIPPRSRPLRPLRPLRQTSPLADGIGTKLAPRDGARGAEFSCEEYGLGLRVEMVQAGLRLTASATLRTDPHLSSYSAMTTTATEIRYPEVAVVVSGPDAPTPTELHALAVETGAIEDVLHLAVEAADLAGTPRAVHDARQERGALTQPGSPALPDAEDERSALFVAEILTHPVGGMLPPYEDERDMVLQVYPQGQSREEYTASRSAELALAATLDVPRGVRPAAVQAGRAAADTALAEAGLVRQGDWTRRPGRSSALVRRAG